MYFLNFATENGMHCNTAETEWSVFKTWWKNFRGVAKRHNYLYLMQYKLQRTYIVIAPIAFGDDAELYFYLPGKAAQHSIWPPSIA
jgi:hypothetical protein